MVSTHFRLQRDTKIMNWSELNENNYIKKINNLSYNDWKPLLHLIPEIEQTLNFGEIDTKLIGEGTVESPYQFPHYKSAPIVNEFIDIVYKIPVVITFQWMEWKELETYVKNTDFDFDTIDIPTKCKVITSIVRAERFCEGNIIVNFKSGLILKILKSIEKQLIS